MSLNRNLLILCMSLIFFSTAHALPEDSKQMINVISDSYEFNYKTGTDIYEGHVQVDQGSTHLIADRLVTQKNDQHKMVSAIAYGITKLAEYHTVPKQGDLVLIAKAKVIKYYPGTATIVLQDQVLVTQGENSFHGPYIVYNIKDQTVSAPPSKQGRAHIVIGPNKISHE